jgi:hypothetical protein
MLMTWIEWMYVYVASPVHNQDTHHLKEDKGECLDRAITLLIMSSGCGHQQKKPAGNSSSTLLSKMQTPANAASTS